MNAVTGFVDGSSVYGSEMNRTQIVRDRVRGAMRVSGPSLGTYVYGFKVPPFKGKIFNRFRPSGSFV